ncbi:histidinol-phosphatase [bacterium]|nr:histidinol-phosphatase [bacterium]
MLHNDEFYEYCGVIHVHTSDSDGTKTHPEIIGIVQDMGLDFLLFNDHMTLKHKHLEGWYGNVLVIMGYEINDQDNHNHFLAYCLDEVLPEHLSSGEYAAEVARRGGVGIIAHPDEVRTSASLPPYPWTDWSVRDFNGIEIWNHLSAWTEGIASSRKLWYFTHPRSFLSTPTPKILRIWDELNRERPVVGIGSTDAHEHKYGKFPFKVKIFPYKVHFTTIRTHLLTRQPLPADFPKAEKEFFRLLTNCQVYFSNYRVAQADGFRFYVRADQSRLIMGETVKFRADMNFYVELPENGEVRLIGSGEHLGVKTGRTLEFRCPGPGIYRVEVMKRGKGWIYSNHIRII